MTLTSDTRRGVNSEALAEYEVELETMGQRLAEIRVEVAELQGSLAAGPRLVLVAPEAPHTVPQS